MNRLRLRAIVASAFLPALALSALRADADPKPAAAKPAASAPKAAPSSAPLGPDGQRVDPAGKTGISPFMIKLVEGERAVVAKDVPRGITILREAVQQAPDDPLGHYVLGEALVVSGSFVDGEAELARALELVGSDDDLHAKILFGIASVRELAQHYSDAKTTWGEYAAFASAHPQAKAFAASAADRDHVIDVHADVARRYAAVKARIEQRLKEAGGPPPDEIPGAKTPAPAKKK